MVMLPTSALVVAAILKYIIGFDGPFDAKEPALTPIVTHPLGETLIVLAPYVALLLAVVPVTRLGLGWRTGRLSATMEVNAPALNIVVAVASVLLAAFMVLYWVAENL
jgi:type IV secretory pathway VirB2 component (pilin)